MVCSYSPNLCPESAFRKLKHWIDLSPGLRDRLEALGGSSRSRTYTPTQVEQVVAVLGEPLKVRSGGVKVTFTDAV